MFHHSAAETICVKPCTDIIKMDSHREVVTSPIYHFSHALLVLLLGVSCKNRCDQRPLRDMVRRKRIHQCLSDGGKEKWVYSLCARDCLKAKLPCTRSRFPPEKQQLRITSGQRAPLPSARPRPQKSCSI